jgi:hypothetical protein
MRSNFIFLVEKFYKGLESEPIAIDENPARKLKKKKEVETEENPPSVKKLMKKKKILFTSTSTTTATPTLQPANNRSMEDSRCKKISFFQ